jgi:hypothetical protein
MRRIIFINLSVILGIVFIMLAFGMYKFNFTDGDMYIQTGGRLDSKDATYIINGEQVTLKNGHNESTAGPDSASKIITRYFGNDASGDLNGDGETDKAFILTQETGGSGIFFYIAAALAKGSNYQGLNAIMLGDRIAPQTTEIRDGKIIVNYATRNLDESFAVPPSVGVSKYFQVESGALVEVDNNE